MSGNEDILEAKNHSSEMQTCDLQSMPTRDSVVAAVVGVLELRTLPQTLGPKL